MTDPTAPEEADVPGSPSTIEATVNKNPTLIIGAGTPDEFTVHYGGGLALLGLQPGELVGTDPRVAFDASGATASEAFESVTTGRRRLVRFRGFYPTASGATSEWDVTLSRNGVPGNWNFVANLVSDGTADNTAYQMDADAPWYARLFQPAVRFLTEVPVGKLFAITACVVLLYGSWAWWRPDGHWKDAVLAGRDWLDVRRVEALARIEEARAAQRSGVQITVDDEGSVDADGADVGTLNVDADEANVTERP